MSKGITAGFAIVAVPLIVLAVKAVEFVRAQLWEK